DAVADVLDQWRIARQGQGHRHRLSRACMRETLAAVRPGLLAERTARVAPQSDALAGATTSGRLQLQVATGSGRNVMEADALGAGISTGNEKERGNKQGREPAGQLEHGWSTTKRSRRRSLEANPTRKSSLVSAHLRA